MISKIEQVFALSSFEDIRAGFIARSRLETQRVADAQAWLAGSGFERVEVSDGTLLTDDGREILRDMHGKAWALQPEIHAKRLAEAMEQAKQRDAALAGQQQPASPPTVCTSLIDGQLCGGTLVRAAVCPRCALGKSGVAATLTCDVCGHVTAIMRGDA